ncbi:MAG: glycosyltransferase family 2 protein [Armatimonadetes bacterium]|nr:glycosyltransferase family 2 protein [Armatimonadota bacterium]MDW8121848.1 glycosyltransferase family 2 protein [Armatimonadota bacterium]
MEKPILTIIVPVYNEVRTIATILDQVTALPISKEIIVVENCSEDGTREFLQKYHHPEVAVHFQERNLGKGSSVRWAIERARGRWLVIQDADLEYDPRDLLRLLERAVSDNLTAVFGKRIFTPEARGSLIYQWGRGLLNLLFRFLFITGTQDVATCYKMIKTEVAQSLRLKCRGFDLDFELASVLRRLGHPIVELPVSYRPRSVAEGKKIRPIDGLKCLWAMVRVRITPRKWLVKI